MVLNYFLFTSLFCNLKFLSIDEKIVALNCWLVKASVYGRR